MQVFKSLGALTLIFAVSVMLSCGDSETKTDVLPDNSPATDEGSDTTDSGSDADTETPCEKQCGDRVCGLDPVCQESCGTCETGYSCDADGQCQQDGCEKACGNRVCGPDPVCQESCGTCETGYSCDADGQCQQDGCEKACGNRVCGPDPVCQESCGTCQAHETCNNEGQCECVPDCGEHKCGKDPVCGTQDCGPCGPEEVCKEGQCCTKNCAYRVCGPDPDCGESCGNCDAGTTCDSVGRCVPESVGTCVDGWCLIEAGTFDMGSPETEQYRDDDEGPVHSVTITRSFIIRETEMTQKEWKALFGNNNPSRYPECGDNCPVEMVNWYEAVHYANTLSQLEHLESCYEISDCSGTFGAGQQTEDLYQCTVTFEGPDCTGYRLPTEAEWEYAARAGTTGPRYAEPPNSIGWCQPESPMNTHPCAGKAANAWGLYDMLGNVSEWVYDWYDENYYSYCLSDCTDPLGTPTSTDMRSYRGGYFSVGYDYLRSASRTRNYPRVRGSNIGFRLIRTVSIPSSN